MLELRLFSGFKTKKKSGFKTKEARIHVHTKKFTKGTYPNTKKKKKNRAQEWRPYMQMPRIILGSIRLKRWINVK